LLFLLWLLLLSLLAWLGRRWLASERELHTMNKARAMMDSLMGPNRDEAVKDKKLAKSAFKDHGVCKSFLIGLCPLDPTYLGGKRKFKPCSLIHSEIMKEQFAASEDADELRKQYQKSSMKEFEHVIRECDGKVADEKARIRDDWGRRRPPLPVPVIDQIARMKRESSSKVKRAEALDDDKFTEKAQLMAEAEEMTKECTELEDRETKKAVEAAIPEEICEVCGTCYQGQAADTAHQQFKIHNAYVLIREKLEEWKPKPGENDEEGKDGKDRDRDRSRDRGRDRDRDRDRSRGRGEKDRGGRRDRSRSRSRDRRQGNRRR